MAEYCDECEFGWEICDFCQHYDFNGTEDGAYTGNGFCREFQNPREPYEGFGCERFKCFRIKDNNNV